MAEDLFAEASKLQKAFVNNLMVSQYDMKRMRRNAVSRDVEWRRVFQPQLDRYNEIRQKHLRGLPSIEMLRPEY